MAELVSFYKKLPVGAAPAPKKATGPFGKYVEKYFGANQSAKPILHFAVLVMLFGYWGEYEHLKAHKDH